MSYYFNSDHKNIILKLKEELKKEILSELQEDLNFSYPDPDPDPNLNLRIEDIELNKLKNIILNGKPLDEVLHCIIVISNPCNYKTRVKLAKEFLLRKYPGVQIYIGELVFGDQEFVLTEPNNKYHLQIRTNTAPLWHKENLINLCIEKLLPTDWKAVAWVDADVRFENIFWAQDALKLLNSEKPIVCQLFSLAIDMDKNMDPLSIFQSFCYQKVIGKIHDGKKTGIHYWHPGYAWACNRTAYNLMGSLFEVSILGSGDFNMAMSFIGKGPISITPSATPEYKKTMDIFQEKVKTIELSAVPGNIRHYFHGHKADRKYMDRWKILVKYNFNPEIHICRDPISGILIPTSECPQGLLDDIMQYFMERNEDIMYEENKS